MNRKFLVLLVTFFILSVKGAMAGGFNLKSIGQISTSGQQISHWWYVGNTPILVGEATAGSTITISIDGIQTTAVADGSGNWTYNPGTLSDGDHTIVLSSGGSTISFTLTLGANNVDWDAVNSGSGETLPAAGVVFPTVLMISISGVLFLVAKKLI